MLSIVATPIGNLGDITLRAIETLKKCDALLCEDTRVTGNLLKQLEIGKKELISFHGHTTPEKVDAIIRRLEKGEHLALVSDAGTPGISDPGFAIVSRARSAGIPIEVIPGPSAFLAALSASGLPIHHFLYLGFLPLKKGRQTLLSSLKEEERTIVFYESVHRIERTLLELAEALKEQPHRLVVIARELTKLHEEVLSTQVSDLTEVAKTLTKKGEFVVILGPKPSSYTLRPTPSSLKGARSSDQCSFRSE
ncbi:MAG: 16S rRNA (cytidine(1402)-2'-O)-methyltransferase [Candidatus Peribacteraceae bacterium]|nr:16S rRNA (cytidine(1402)-2'-O)-methyltransferase [Candidatus Peribacteraceae bacterium]